MVDSLREAADIIEMQKHKGCITATPKSKNGKVQSYQHRGKLLFYFLESLLIFFSFTSTIVFIVCLKNDMVNQCESM